MAAGQSVQTKLVQALAQQFGVRVYGGVTCLLQITDTDYSASFKAGVSAAQHEERQEQKAAAKSIGAKVEFKCGPLEIVKIIKQAQVVQNQRQEQRPWILKACRRNGYFHWRPDVLQQRLVEVSKQKWAEDMPEGSYRFPSRWLEERGEWMKNGRPSRSSIEDQELAEKAAADMEADFCRKEGYMQIINANGKKFEEHHAVIEADAADEEDVTGACEDDMMDPKIRRILLKGQQNEGCRCNEEDAEEEEEEEEEEG